MGIQEKKQMAVVDEAMKEAQTKLATIGVKASMKCDWDSYDKIPWQDSDNKLMQYGKVKNTFAALADGIVEICADADYKEALAGLTEVVLMPTENTSITVAAKHAGTILTFENYHNGSSRGASDFVNAIRKALG